MSTFRDLGSEHEKGNTEPKYACRLHRKEKKKTKEKAKIEEYAHILILADSRRHRSQRAAAIVANRAGNACASGPGPRPVLLKRIYVL